MTANVIVSGSTSNLGAGFDFFGIAINLHLKAELSDGEGPPEYTGTLEGMTPEEDIIYQILRTAGVTRGAKLKVHSEIPLSRGLGSSGAAAVAGYSLATARKGDTFDVDLVFELARQVEGHPDNVGPSVYGGAVISAERPTRIEVHSELALAFAIPNDPIRTDDARRILPTTVPRETAVDQASRAAALVRGIANGDPELIGFGMVDRLAVPYRKDLIKGYEAATTAARDAGAYGITISGSGSTLVAITDRSKAKVVSEAMAFGLKQEGNHAVPFTSIISERGVRIVY